MRTAEMCLKSRIRTSTFVVLVSVALAVPAAAQTLDTRFGELEFEGGYPTRDTARRLYEELDFQRAVQAYLWALPMASYGAMADCHRLMGAGIQPKAEKVNG